MTFLKNILLVFVPSEKFYERPATADRLDGRTVNALASYVRGLEFIPQAGQILCSVTNSLSRFKFIFVTSLI